MTNLSQANTASSAPGSAGAAGGDAPLLHIGPSNRWAPLNLRELWRYRELLGFLAWRDIKVRYKQTVLGAGWAILQPVLTMAIFTIVFGRLAAIPSEGVPYAIFTLCALLPWQLFANSINQAGMSLLNQQGLVTKVYFPRLIVPLSSVLASTLDFAISLAVLAVMMPIYGIVPGWSILAAPVFVAMGLLASVAIGVWLSALVVQYRDFRHTLVFITQLWLFATPIAYPSSLVPPAWRALYGLNPMVGVIEGFRWAMLGKPDPAWKMMAVSTVCVAALLVSGLYYFRRAERNLADVV